MKFIADFHLHSKYSRATSKDMDLAHLSEWADYKGLDIIGTGDFTHPIWLNLIRLNLKEDGSGLLQFSNAKARFILSAEISSIYSQGGRTRKVHTLVLVPTLEAAIKIHYALAQRGNVYSDGRPILGLSAKEVAKIILEINPKALIIPAHAWTPWFSVFGANSVFDSLKECYGDITNEIFAIETGLSSDPPMNWRLSALDNITLISNSDAHSPQNLGREANVFDLPELTYAEIYETIKNKDKNKLLETLEFFPEEGKYHYDGHRACQVVINPFLKKYPDNLCPLCHKKLTIGVAHRVEALADRPKGEQKENFPGFKNLVPLREIIASAFGLGVNSKKVQSEYLDIVKTTPEFKILLDLAENDLEKNFHPKIAEGITRARKGLVKIEPGYDGVYGKVKIFDEEDLSIQKSLF